MSTNESDSKIKETAKQVVTIETPPKGETAKKKREFTKDWKKKLWWALAHAAGLVFVFYAVQYAAAFILYAVYGDNLESMAADPVFTTVLSAALYAVMLAVIILVPWKLLKQKISTKILGLTKWPSWTDILLAPASFIVYLIGAAILSAIAAGVLPWFDANQVQDVGYTVDNLVSSTDYILAFVALVVLAPIIEEIIFRGYLYGKLRSKLGIVVSMLIVSVLFGVAHGQWNVGVNVFAMSLVMCGLREITGSIWAGVLLHMLKNGIAYYLLFVNSSFLSGALGN